MKLFVVGEDTPDPKEWAKHGGWSLVIAEDEAQARALAAEWPDDPVSEIPLDRARKLLTMVDLNDCRF